MELRRNQMKYFSSDNMRLLSSLILSLSSKQSSMENKLIDYWTPSTAYIKDESMVIYDDAIQICKISNADDTFNQNKWLKLSPEIDELSKSDVEAMLNLSSEELANLQSLIDDTTITTTKTNSSSKIYMDIQAAIAECKDDTLKQIAKKVSGSYKIAASTSDVTSADFIYLINNGVNYDLYVLVDSVPTRVGDTSIDLSDYAKLTDLADYLKKTDATSTYATITKVDEKVNKTDIVDNLTSTDTDKPLSANQGKVLKDEVDLKAKDSEVVKKTDIVTTIDKSSTNDKVPSASAIYNKSKNKIADLPNGTDIIAYADSISNETVADTVRIMNALNSPYNAVGIGSDFYYTIYNISDDNYKRIVAYDIRKNDMYMIMKHSGKWGTWRKVITTSIKDVGKTLITISDETNYKNSAGTESFYTVKNGTCYVTLCIDCVSPLNNTIISTLPKAYGGVFRFSLGKADSAMDGYVLQDGTLKLSGGTAGARYYACSFSYPVAEG